MFARVYWRICFGEAGKRVGCFPAVSVCTSGNLSLQASLPASVIFLRAGCTNVCLRVCLGKKSLRVFASVKVLPDRPVISVWTLSTVAAKAVLYFTLCRHQRERFELHNYKHTFMYTHKKKMLRHSIGCALLLSKSLKHI